MGAVALVIAANELQKSLMGVNDKSQIDLLKTIRDDQKRLITLILSQGKLLEKLNKQAKPSKDYIFGLLAN